MILRDVSFYSNETPHVVAKLIKILFLLSCCKLFNSECFWLIVAGIPFHVDDLSSGLEFGLTCFTVASVAASSDLIS